jgi:hypothetical protein
MKRTTAALLLLLMILIFPVSLTAAEFGITLDQELGFGGIGSDAEIDNVTGLIPYFSTSIGNSSSFYISAFLKGVYEYETFVFVAELLHTEFSWKNDSFKIRVGRIPYAAPLDFIAEGFFDGLQAFYDTKIGTFSAGGWYTGLIYKKSANITMTADDLISYYTDLDYGEFADTYFASRRILMSIDWENPAIAGQIRVKGGVMGQIDVNDTYSPYHSVYFTAKGAIPVKDFILAAGGSLQIANANDEVGIGLAGELGAAWILSSSFFSQLSLIGRFSSGETDGLTAFSPVTTKPQGNVLQARLSGISALFLDYTAQLHKSVNAGLTASYFFRSDEETHLVYPVMNPIDDTGFALGCEFFGRVVWTPLTDLDITFGAGIFLPYLGNVNPKAGTQWRLELGIVLVIF